MKKLFICIAVLAISNTFGQAFDGYGDNKTSIGLTTQSGATGLVFNFDKGLDDNFSFGSTFGFTVSSNTSEDAERIEKGDALMERIDFGLRLNYHFGKQIGLSDMSDVYGGASLNARNIGVNVGYTFMVSDGFGFFAEAAVPVYKYNLFNGTDNVSYYNFYNQPVFGIGIVINK
jgi:hypothetical protein